MFAAAAKLANQAVLRIHGQPVTLRHGSVETVVQAVFQAAAERFNSRSVSGGPADLLLDGSVFERGDAILIVSTADVMASQLATGDRADVGGCTYRIVDVLDDQCGMTTAVLRAAWR